MRTLRHRVQQLEQRRLQQRETIEEIGRTNVGQLTEQELWIFLAACLDRSVGAISEQELEKIAYGALVGGASPQMHSPPSASPRGCPLTLAQAASELLRRRRARNKIRTFFPDTGPLRRELYPKHLEFFAAGKDYMERCFLAGNQTGKTEAGAYETTLHLTGVYPDWWEGRRFDRPIQGWAAGETNRETRDVIQKKLLGEWNERGTGMIPADSIVHVTTKAGVAETADTIYVRHRSGGISWLSLKSYEQKRKSFQGATLDLIWLDEECPIDIYEECLIRLMVKRGIVMLTFTPLMGLTPLVLRYLPGGKID